MEENTKRASISVLRELRALIYNGETFDSIVAKWQENNPGIDVADEGVRLAYARTVDDIINHLLGTDS